jgi:hypothetical protein
VNAHTSASLRRSGTKKRVRIVRFLAALALLLCPLAALADEVDLSRSITGRRSDQPPQFILRAEGGSEFSPYGYAGAVLSVMLGDSFEVEGGMGAGFPGLQLGLAARTLFGEEGKYILGELSLAGNTRQDRGAQTQAGVTFNNSSLWTTFGLGAELRQGFYSVDLVGSIVFTTNDLTPHFAIHGGIGFGF